MLLPQGWALHPTHPAYMYEVANPANVHPLPVQAAPPIPPAPVPGHPVGYPPAAQQQFAQQQQLYAPPQTPQDFAQKSMDWGSPTLDSSAVATDIQRTFTRKYDAGAQVWLKLPEVKREGEMGEMHIYLLPGARKEKSPEEVSRSWVNRVEHTVPGDWAPMKDGKKAREWVSVNCLNHELGPKNCPVCKLYDAAVTLGRAEELYHLKAAHRWALLCVNLRDPGAHLVQMKDEAGSPMVDQMGQPMNKMVPGVLTIPQTAARDLLTKIRNRTRSPQHPEAGYPIVITKTKIGSARQNVKYSVDCLEPTPLPAQFRSVLAHPADIETRFTDFDPKQVMELATHIASVVGLPLNASPETLSATQAATPMPYPGAAPVPAAPPPPPAGYGFPPATTAIPAVPYAAPPPPPHVPPPQGYAPPSYGVPPGYQVPPPAPPAALPIHPSMAGAPGALPGVVPGAPPGYAPMPAPGMPMPPVGVSAAAAGLTADEAFESELGTDAGSDDIPF